MSIPFFGNDRESLEYGETFHLLAQEVWQTGQFLNGPWVNKFEQNLAKYCQRKYAVALNSCTDALIFGIESLNLSRCKIIVPDFSFISSASAILQAGHSPLFCDVSNENAMLTKDNLESFNFKKEETKALIAVSLYGAMAPMTDIQEYCHKNDLILIEDAAQSLGSSFQEKPAGSFGAFSTLSFDPTKTLHGMGAGGALLTDDKNIYEKVLEKRLHGRDKDLKFSNLGRKSLLPSQDAHIMNFKLTKLSQWLERRKAIAKAYLKALSECTYAKALSTPESSTHAYHKFVIKCQDVKTRELLQQAFKKANIVTRIHYDKPLSKNDVFKDFKANTPNAHELSQSVLSLPIFHELTDSEVETICSVLTSFKAN